MSNRVAICKCGKKFKVCRGPKTPYCPTCRAAKKEAYQVEYRRLWRYRGGPGKQAKEHSVKNGQSNITFLPDHASAMKKAGHYSMSDILHAPPEKAIEMINAILAEG